MPDDKKDQDAPKAAPATATAAPATEVRMVMSSGEYARMQAAGVLEDAARMKLDTLDEGDVRDIGHGYRGAGRYLLSDGKTWVDANGNEIKDKGD